MPIFEFECGECRARFEQITSADSSVACPKCSSKKTERLLSRFAVGKGGEPSFSGAGLGGACGSCGDPRGPGACSWDDAD